MTDAEADDFAPEVIHCIDFAVVIAQRADIEGIDAECFGDVFDDNSAFADAFARRMVDPESDFTINASEATSLAEDSAGCIDIVEVIEKRGTELDDTQQACVQEEFDALDPNPWVEMLAATFQDDEAASADAKTSAGGDIADVLRACDVGTSTTR